MHPNSWWRDGGSLGMYADSLGGLRERSLPAQVHVQGVYFKLIDPTPAATFNPLLSETLSG